ncbi:hypothetical protein [Alkaliphilus peptidifermentans]|uniref:Uncharacterized protein n=1 Tax=Alkaliphilus peptidifermentans DSM 18978 TaxID=1120976 RepID=A0A1G5GFM7_9FIRM|nr:hypothetical protein [Alkaliphilus peptidifermentans]SCY50345.1 hypothetical protein SAMN03080606_01673 [Alkaliphilus peptidifermentans DSM 18978]
MKSKKSKSNNWITIKNLRSKGNEPNSVVVDFNGNVYIDGVLYDENNAKYENLSIDVEKHNRVSTGEETQKMFKGFEEANEGETITIKDEKDQNRREKTTIKY